MTSLSGSNRQSVVAGRTGTTQTSTKPKRKIRVMGFDGAKVHDLLFHVALSEIQWRDLSSIPPNQNSSLVQNHQARSRGSMLYERFLRACAEGPGHATTFLAQQYKLQKMYLQKSQALLQSSGLKLAKDQAFLSEVAFGAQVVKSTATVGVAIIGLFLAGPEVILGAGIGLGFDVAMEMVSRMGEAKADAVVVGFKQTVANDVVNVAGSTQQVGLDSAKKVMEKTLSYPMKSSIYRSAAKTAVDLNRLMIAMGMISAGVTLYTEGSAALGSYDQMIEAQSYASSLQDRQR